MTAPSSTNSLSLLIRNKALRSKKWWQTIKKRRARKWMRKKKVRWLLLHMYLCAKERNHFVLCMVTVCWFLMWFISLIICLCLHILVDRCCWLLLLFVLWVWKESFRVVCTLFLRSRVVLAISLIIFALYWFILVDLCRCLLLILLRCRSSFIHHRCCWCRHGIPFVFILFLFLLIVLCICFRSRWSGSSKWISARGHSGSFRHCRCGTLLFIHQGMVREREPERKWSVLSFLSLHFFLPLTPISFHCPDELLLFCSINLMDPLSLSCSFSLVVFFLFLSVFFPFPWFFVSFWAYFLRVSSCRSGFRRMALCANGSSSMIR